MGLAENIQLDYYKKTEKHVALVDIRFIIKSIFEEITKELIEDKEVSIKEFGKFSTSFIENHNFVENVVAKSRMKSYCKISFKPGTSIKRKINQKYLVQQDS